MKNKLFRNKIFLGVGAGLIALFFYSLINIFSQSFNELLKIKYWAPIVAVAFVGVKEGVALTTFFISKPKNSYKEIKEVVVDDKKTATLAMIAGIFGGAIGFSLTTAGGLYLSSGLASPFYTIEIVMVLIVVRFLFKRRPNLWQIIGITTIFFSLLMIPILDITIHGNGSQSKNVWIGVSLLTLGVAAWAVETIIFDKISENERHSLLALIGLKQIASFLFIFIFLFPFFSLIHNDGYSLTYKMFGTLFNENWEAMLIAIVAGVLLYFGRVFFFISNKHLGGTMSNAIYALLSLVQIPLALIANAITSGTTDYMGNIHHEYFWALMIILICGVLLSIYGQFKNDMKKL